ncbi:pyridoxal phosphate-dependent aminotransferase [Candidatus Bathyarchaeota archaeon]|nr:pyridoxal phosphate-dependent aminotransferase [Candidatus Bathyarchaeota archaeon]
MLQESESSVAAQVLSRKAQKLCDLLGLQTSVAIKGQINLGTGTPDFPTPAHIIEAGKGALDEGYTSYTPWIGIPQLREAIAAKLQTDNGLRVDPESEVLVTTGTQEALMVTMLSLVDPAEEVLIPSPYYGQYEQDLILAGGRLVPVPTFEQDDFEVDPREIEKRITSKTKAILLVSPSNPTANVLYRETLDGVAEIAEKYNLIVISDELYEKYVYEDYKHYSIGSFPGMWERTITINGFSKCYSMTGWRVGYIAAPARFISGMLPIKHAMTICAPAMSQWAALAALTGPQDWWREVMTEYGKRRRFWMESLDEMGLTYGVPRGAYYIFVSITSTGLSSEQFVAALREEARVVVGSGAHYGEEGEGYVRVSLAVPFSLLEEGLDRMKKVVRVFQARRK